MCDFIVRIFGIKYVVGGRRFVIDGLYLCRCNQDLKDTALVLFVTEIIFIFFLSVIGNRC